MRAILLWSVATLAVMGCAVEGQDPGVMKFMSALKTCFDQVKPTEDDLSLLVQGNLTSNGSVGMITCAFKEAKVIQDKTFNSTNAALFLSALTPGSDTEAKMKMFTQISEKCSSVIVPEPTATEEDIATKIYYCILKEGSAAGKDVLGGVEVPKT